MRRQSPPLANSLIQIPTGLRIGSIRALQSQGWGDGRMKVHWWNSVEQLALTPSALGLNAASTVCPLTVMRENLIHRYQSRQLAPSSRRSHLACETLLTCKNRDTQSEERDTSTQYWHSMSPDTFPQTTNPAIVSQTLQIPWIWQE